MGPGTILDRLWDQIWSRYRTLLGAFGAFCPVLFRITFSALEAAMSAPGGYLHSPLHSALHWVLHSALHWAQHCMRKALP